MPRKKGMKLDQALKLYIALYFLCFGLTWMISVPMLIHVTPESECLLFVSPYVKYGPSAGKSTEIFFSSSIKSIYFSACNFVGFAPIAVALATAVLIVLHMMQLKSLKSFLRQPGPHQSSNYHQRPTHIFWRLVSKRFIEHFFKQQTTIFRVEQTRLRNLSTLDNYLVFFRTFCSSIRF